MFRFRTMWRVFTLIGSLLPAIAFNTWAMHSPLPDQKIKQFQSGKMSVTWWFEGQTKIVFEVSAPTDGWIALGFNTKDNIVGTNLIMANAIQGQLTIEDRFVESIGVHKKVPGTPRFISSDIQSDKRRSTVTFALPTKASTQYHHSLLQGTDIVLVLAYSLSPEFHHHSVYHNYHRTRL